MQCGLCGAVMHVSKVAYTRGWVRRRRKCTGCGQAWTSRERFDGAVLDPERGLVPEGWPVAHHKKPRRRPAPLFPNPRLTLAEMVRALNPGNSRGVQDGDEGDGSGE